MKQKHKATFYLSIELCKWFSTNQKAHSFLFLYEILKKKNRRLQQIGKKAIKSKETVRSWEKCRNKRYRQAEQHRRQNLWAHLRPQKKHNQRHINVHYNRAHVKNYTRFAFASSSAVHGKSLVIRRAIDDKAYVRCGTSEGFSRPLHTPLQLNTGPDSHFKLPSADYSDPVGCRTWSNTNG